MTAPDYRARIVEMRKAALKLDACGDVIGFDADLWAQADELSASLGMRKGDAILGLRRKRSPYSAWLYCPEHVLRWQQPESWEVCCRLYAADVAARVLGFCDAAARPVASESRAVVQAARDHAHGRISDAELAEALAAARVAPLGVARVVAWAAIDSPARAACRGAVWADAWISEQVEHSSDVGERRAQWQRLMQYVNHGPAAEHMAWPTETQSQETP